MKLNMFPKWIHVVAIINSLVYLGAQAELFATVIPAFPTWDMTGFLGSTMWLMWLIIVGTSFIGNKKELL